LLNGSRKRQRALNHVPVYGVPDDLLVIDLGDAYPN